MGEAMITRRGGGGMQIDGLLDEYVVSSGSISAGDFVKWVLTMRTLNSNMGRTAGDGKYTVAKIDDSRVVVGYVYAASSAMSANKYYYVCVITFTATSATTGTPTQISSSTISITNSAGGYNPMDYVDIYPIGNNQFRIFSPTPNRGQAWLEGKFTVNDNNLITINQTLAYSALLRPSDAPTMRVFQLAQELFATAYGTSSGNLIVTVYIYNGDTITSKNGGAYTDATIAGSHVLGFAKMGSEQYACIINDNTDLKMIYFSIGDTSIAIIRISRLDTKPDGLALGQLPDGRYLIPCYASVASSVQYYPGVLLLTETSGYLAKGAITQVGTTTVNTVNQTWRRAIANLPGGRVIVFRQSSYVGGYKMYYDLLMINGDVITVMDANADTGVSMNVQQLASSIVGVNDRVIMLIEPTRYYMGLLNICDDITKCTSGEEVAGLAAEDGTAGSSVSVYHPA